ncbi:MAG: hypothetical protein M1817_005114 [Caeruleum heppii]|nr:MAG: hypothetical protein M1817_005114 [Caeruleum heppii]
MSSITLKISSLVIRTLSKPIANRIKAQAREHARFRRACVSFAQSLHRLDMRMRLGLLTDPAILQRQTDKADKEAAEAAAKKAQQKTESAVTDETRSTLSKEKSDKSSSTKPKPRIRPLSEAKAIDTGANFISETFLFLVGGSLILFESFRSRRKENTRREDVADRLQELEESERAARRAVVALEKEILRLRREKEGKREVGRILASEMWDLEEEDEKAEQQPSGRWWNLWGSAARKEASEEKSSSLETPKRERPLPAQPIVVSSSPSNPISTPRPSPKEEG